MPLLLPLQSFRSLYFPVISALPFSLPMDTVLAAAAAADDEEEEEEEEVVEAEGAVFSAVAIVVQGKGSCE